MMDLNIKLSPEDIKLLCNIAMDNRTPSYGSPLVPNVKIDSMHISESVNADELMNKFASALEEMAKSSLNLKEE